MPVTFDARLLYLKLFCNLIHLKSTVATAHAIATKAFFFRQMRAPQDGDPPMQSIPIAIKAMAASVGENAQRAVKRDARQKTESPDWRGCLRQKCLEPQWLR